MGESSQKLQRGRGRGILREFSAGGVVFKKNKWLVAKSVASDLYPEPWWRLPKGWIDDSDTQGIPGPMGRGEVRADEESLQKAALREVEEEGGVKAEIVKKIGSVKLFFSTPDRGKILKFVTYYLMKWIRDLPEGFGEESSEIAWLPFEEAAKKLKFSSEKQILKKAEEIRLNVS